MLRYGEPVGPLRRGKGGLSADLPYLAAVQPLDVVDRAAVRVVGEMGALAQLAEGLLTCRAAGTLVRSPMLSV